MTQDLYKSFERMILAKGHLIDKDCDIKYLDEETDVERKIQAINTFHKETIGYKFNIGEKIQNTLGKNVEDSKVDLRRLKRYVDNIRNKSNILAEEEILLSMGQEFIERGDRSIKLVYDSNYIELIKRSMRNWEIDFGGKAIDLLDFDGRLIIKTLNECSYDMVEWDYISLVIKLKRRGVKFPIKDMLEHCTCIEGLNKDSFNFMIAMSDFPYDFMKNFNRYNDNNWTLSELRERMKRANLRDGKSILGEGEISWK